MKSRLSALLIIVLFGFSISISAVDYCVSSSFGYGSSATGGGDKTPVLVKSVSELKSALNKGKDKVIIITQDLTFTSMLSVADGANVTLMGLPGVTLTSLQQDKSTSGILYVKRFNNLIIRNLTFVGPGAYDCDGNDLLCFEGVTKAWVDHCDFQDGCDGNFDNKGNTDNVTVSWCRFRYLKAPKAGGSGGSDDHRFTNLLGSSSSDKPIDGTYNFTWAYCWWDNGCKERMVRCRNCDLHFLNCYWNSSVANYYVGPENAKCYFEGCTFEGKANSSSKIFKSYGGTNACKFVDCSGNLPSNSGTVSAPTYSYTASGRAEAKTAVTNASCGAGATLTVTTAGAVSSACDGGAPAPTVYTVTWNATENGGSCGTATSFVTSGNAIGSLPEATKDGYTFDGWYTAPSGDTKITSATTVSGNITYYAQFTSTPVTTYYTIIWDANGGSCGTASTFVESGKAISTAIASLPTAMKAGDYSFDGWYTAISGGTKITTGTVINANVTYYAHYTATSGGGSGSGDCYEWAGSPSSLTDGSLTANTNLQLTAGAGASIDNAAVWSGSGNKVIFKIDGASKYIEGHLIDNSDITSVTVSAATNQSAAKIYAIVFSPNSAFTSDLTVYTHTAPSKDDAKDDSKLVREFTAPSGTKYFRVYRKFTYEDTEYGDNQTIRVYGVEACSGSSSTPTTFALYYDENGGSGTMAETEQTGSSVTVAANAFTAPTGYAFKEWNASMSGGDETVYTAGQELTLTEDLTIYAIWTPQSYTVTLNAESGTGGSASVKATFDEAMPSIAVPTRSGYIFKGYFIGVGGTGTQYYDENGSSTNSWAIPEDTELHAYWIAGSTPDPTGCELNFWFFKEADATANGKTNSAIFSGMVSDASDKSGSITIDGTSYSVTRRTGDNATFGQFTIPSGKTGVFYALAISSGSGDRQINLVGPSTYELPVAGGSDSYKRIESEELPAGTYSIERDGSSNVRLGIVVIKICTAMPASDAPTISVQPVGANYCAGDAVSALSVTAAGSGTVTYQWKKEGVDISGETSNSYTPSESGTYVCVVTNTEDGKSATSLASDEAEITIQGVITAPTFSQTGNTVSLSTTTAGATIYYTTDGSAPTTSSASGTSVVITADCTIKAYAVKDGCNSAIESFAATYDADACMEPAALTNEIARFFVPCGTGTIKYEVTNEPSSTGMNTFTTYKTGSTNTGDWYTNTTTKWSYGKMTGNDSYIQIKLNTGSFTEGDVVRVYINRNSTSKTGLKVHSSSGNTINVSSTASEVETEGTYTLVSEDIESDGSLKFFRAGSASYINRIIITRPVAYSITYDCDGAESGCPTDVAAAYNLPDPLPDAPTKSGFDFEGWYTDAAKTIAAVASATLTEDVTLYAKWAATRPEPAFTWTYDGTMQAGGVYPVSVASTGDGDVTLSMVSAVTGVSLSSATANPATGTISLSASPAELTFTLRATSASTANYKAHSEDKIITITICETAYNLAYGVGYVDAGSKATPRYYHETAGVGKITKGNGGSSNEGDVASWTGESWIVKSNKNSSHLLQTYLSDVQKIEFYVKAGGTNVTINKLRRSDSYISGTSGGDDALSGASIIYNNDPTKTGLTKDKQEVATVILAAPLRANDFLMVNFSSSSTLYGAKLYRAEGDEPTSVAYTVGSDIMKFVGDPSFTRIAHQTTSGIPSNGVISYSSEDETVATVDAGTGEVTINNIGRTRIVATLSTCGCFKSSTASYNLIVKPCTDDECTIAITSGSAKKCAGTSVTLTATASAGATFQWYKNWVALPGETNATLTTSEEGEYYAEARKVCLQKSNTINVTDFESPTAEALHEYYYVKSGRVTPDIPLFKVTNTSSFVMSHPAPSGCSYELREDDIVYLTGVPATGLAAASYTLTITAKNPCGGAEANASMTFHVLAQTAKPTLAWIGCKGDGKNQQALPGTLDASQSTSHSLYIYLQGYFDLTPVNAYCTIDAKKISDYYSQFDLVLLTDYPNSHVCPTGDIDPATGNKYKETDANSYSNAIGSLIDEKPILTFEAFVAGLPNWGINTTPGPQSPTEKEITLLCAAHNIFDHTIPIDEKILFVQSSSSSGLQGFAGLEAPSGMIYIATISDGSGGTRIACCERQTVIPARMMIMGLNHNAMADVTDEGKIIIKQIIEYLLQTTNIADCALVFDDQTGDHKWSTPGNWAPAHNIVPKPFQAVRIQKDCEVDVPNAHCSSVRLMKGTIGTETYDAHLTILSSGGLTVTDYVKAVHNANFMTTYPISSSDLVIHSDETGNGALVFGNESEDLAATVQYYSKAYNAGTASPVWQYIGIPVSNRPMAIDAYYESWMCSWENVGNVSSNWRWVENEDRITPFKGYCITQNSKKTYTHIGYLNRPESKDLTLRYFSSPDGDGFNMFANSWVAPIDIKKIETEDFGGSAEPTIFIYNSGSRADYESGGDPSTVGTNTGVGQYNAIPVKAASYLAGALTKIPSMQGFFIKATKNGTITLDYNKICFNTATFETTTEPTRAPKRINENVEPALVPQVMRLDVSSDKWSDRLFILTHPEFSEAFNLGWDGSKQEGDEQAPMLSLSTEVGLLAVAAIESAEERYLSFRAGDDTEYTFSFNYDGDCLYLFDRATEQATLIRTGNTYRFSAVNKTPENRFLITAHPQGTPTDIKSWESESLEFRGAQKFIREDKMFILYRGVVYDALGERIERKEVTP